MITGASAGPAYAERYDKWRTSLVTMLKQKIQLPRRSSVRAGGERGPERREIDARERSRGARPPAREGRLRRSVVHHPHRPRDDGRRRSEIQPGGPGLDRGRVGRALGPIAGTRGVRRHHRGELSFPSPSVGAGSGRRHGDRFRGATVRNRVRGVFRQARSTGSRPISTRTAGCRSGRRSATPAPR